MQQKLSFFRESHPEPAARDTAISHAILQKVSDGTMQQSLRLYRPNNVIAFGPLDPTETDFLKAVTFVRSRGFDCIQRLVGGRAAMFHQGTLAFGLTLFDCQPRNNIEHNYQMVAEVLVSAFKRLGLESQIGPVKGEYCPGKYSINSHGQFKLAGIGQRLARNATYMGGVISLQENLVAEEILIQVYSSLNLELNLNSFGNLKMELPSISYTQLEGAILDELATQFHLEENSIPTEIIKLAATFEPRHTIPK